MKMFTITETRAYVIHAQTAQEAWSRFDRGRLTHKDEDDAAPCCDGSVIYDNDHECNYAVIEQKVNGMPVPDAWRKETQ